MNFKISLPMGVHMGGTQNSVAQRKYPMCAGY